jgi:predicted metal-dependent HD superfamily phosphohydrolase
MQVRLEYAWAPLDRWLEGRTGFLSSYLAHERLYFSAEGTAELEGAARANMAAERARLARRLHWRQ